MRKLLMAAALFAALPFAPAIAAPAAPATAQAAAVQPMASPSLLLVGHHRNHWRGDRRHWRHHHARPGRYHRPPPGWRRYHARPHNWRARGCIAIGPAWFCR